MNFCIYHIPVYIFVFIYLNCIFLYYDIEWILYWYIIVYLYRNVYMYQSVYLCTKVQIAASNCIIAIRALNVAFSLFIRVYLLIHSYSALMLYSYCCIPTNTLYYTAASQLHASGKHVPLMMPRRTVACHSLAPLPPAPRR